MVKQKLDKRSRTTKRVMASKKGKSKQVVVLNESMRVSRGQRLRGYARYAQRRGKEKLFAGSNKLKSTLDPYAKALGYGTLAVAAYSKVQPNGSMQTAQLAGLAGEYYGGGLKGAIGAEIIKAFVGAPSLLSGLNLGNILGGQQNQMQTMTGNSMLL